MGYRLPSRRDEERHDDYREIGQHEQREGERVQNLFEACAVYLPPLADCCYRAEREQREALRREFSANVSHELKTPLQSVLGYSEIMLSGLVKPEDTKRFLQKINDEAHNLLRLIDDIMQLSKLDELTHDMMEEFTLQDVAQSALARLCLLYTSPSPRDTR